MTNELDSTIDGDQASSGGAPDSPLRPNFPPPFASGVSGECEAGRIDSSWAGYEASSSCSEISRVTKFQKALVGWMAKKIMYLRARAVGHRGALEPVTGEQGNEDRRITTREPW